MGERAHAASEMLGHAVEWEYLTANPALGVRRPRIERKEMQVLGPAQIRKLLKKADGTTARTMILTAVTTGVRRGELLALRWGDVDWFSKRIWARPSKGRRWMGTTSSVASSIPHCDGRVYRRSASMNCT